MTLPKPRLVALGRDVDIAVPPRAPKEAQVKLLVSSGRLRFIELLRRLDRSELKTICRAHGVDDSGRARQTLAARLMQARGGVESAPPQSIFPANDAKHLIPRPRDIVLCRHRQWLVEDAVPAAAPDEATVVHLSCLDDDNQGRALSVLWELELGARVHRPDAHGLGEITQIDEPRRFGAYLNTLKWNSVTATDNRLFQAPFRAGIALKSYQLVPLLKALELPRANLFIADDVGLGKTIEAGLVLSELTLRQRVDFALVICPAGVTLQWRDEMQRRFGVRFEVMSRAFVARRRKERGFGVNPWSTHARFIVSHQLLRRPEYREGLLSHLGDRARKSLLILDEAHVAAPASAARYAVDSDLTKVMRDIAPRFENRLFLSATPHNGHSNSFSALLELLDPQRFTRGVPIKGDKQLKPVMVRRLKQDLREANIDHSFPERRVVQLALTHVHGEWRVRERQWNPQHHGYDEGEPRSLGRAEPFELDLERDLLRYTELVGAKGRARLSLINLHKRLLSSVNAFRRTLAAHEKSVSAKPSNVIELAPSEQDDTTNADEEHGADEETLELARATQVARRSKELPELSSEARALLDKMRRDAEHASQRPDAKTLALIDWIRRHQCPAARVRGPKSEPPRGRGRADNNDSWTDCRLIIFTEYGDTKKYLQDILSAAIAGTDQADERIKHLHGGMSDEAREEVRNAFNMPPSDSPVRILIATDAAREGINLQAYCSNIVHFDVPWNPARLEQRNGRIDRTLQPQPEVYCRYFSYSDRMADPVLATLVEKVEVISRELGSLGAVVAEQISEDLETHGITPDAATRLEAKSKPAGHNTVREELDPAIPERHRLLKAEVDDADTVLHTSKQQLRFSPEQLQEVVNVGLELSGASALHQRTAAKGGEPATYTLPDLPDSWQATLDTLRPARTREQSFWEFRAQPPLPVSFEPIQKLDAQAAQLHLQHPLVQRLLSRFLAQGFSNHDLSRVTIVRNKHDALVRVIAFGRLSLFGAGAARLHDELIPVAARWLDGKRDPLQVFDDRTSRETAHMLEELLQQAPSLTGLAMQLQNRVVEAAPDLFARLWTPLREEADNSARRAEDKLKERGRKEADQLRALLKSQRHSLEQAVKERDRGQKQLDTELRKQERAQLHAETEHMRRRLSEIHEELEREPKQIEALYDVALRRFTPVGLVVLWPATR